MLEIITETCKNLTHPNNLIILGDSSLYLGMFFGACGILGEIENNPHIHSCLKTNLKIASNFLIVGSILNLYRVNRF